MYSAIDAGYRRSIIKHNELVDRNRHALNRIINCIKFCGFHELPLRGHDEMEGYTNRGVFLDLVTYTEDLDGAFRDHLEKYNVVKNTSKSIQNDFLSCMLKVYTEEITREIKNSSCVSVQADETTDISCKSQFVIIVRYVKDFKPVERFLKFVELQDGTANGLTQALKENLDSLNLESKFIAQAYVCWRGSNEGFHKWSPGSNEKAFPTRSLRSLLRSPTESDYKENGFLQQKA